MITIVYFTTKNTSNQERTFAGVREFNAWVKRNSEILMDYTVVKAPKELKLKLHYRN